MWEEEGQSGGADWSDDYGYGGGESGGDWGGESGGDWGGESGGDWSGDGGDWSTEGGDYGDWGAEGGDYGDWGAEGGGYGGDWSGEGGDWGAEGGDWGGEGGDSGAEGGDWGGEGGGYGDEWGAEGTDGGGYGDEGGGGESGQEGDNQTYGFLGTAGKWLGRAALNGLKNAGKEAGKQVGEAGLDGTLGDKYRSGKLTDDIVDGLEKTPVLPSLDDPTANPVEGLAQRGLGTLLRAGVDLKRGLEGLPDFLRGLRSRMVPGG